MIERLNFYDVYGYVVPGFAFVALYWLPFGLVGRGWPTSEWASAVAALATSFVAGFLLHRIGTKALSSKTMNGRFPSSATLDDPGVVPNGTFSRTFWNELRRIIQHDFDLDIAIETRRADAFFACRAALLANKRGQYCEQFQGLYAMSRGLLFAFGAAAPYYLGWYGKTLFTCGIGAALSCPLLLRAYQDHTKDFARQVYTDYYAMRKLPGSSTPT